MRHAPLFAALAVIPLVVAAVPAQKIGEVPKAAPTSAAPKGTTLEWTSDAGQPYWYRLPKVIKESSPPNLILMLHGTGLNHGWSFWNYGIDGGNFRPDDIVVSPDGCTPGQGSTFNFVQGKKDGDQIAQLIQTFRTEFPIGNVYLYGHSQGAFFCYWFAGAHPELVNGIVAHAGNVLDVAHPKHAIENIAIGILHAASDQVVTVECAHRTEAIYKEKGYKKLRCDIIEGIRPEAGHWPLPAQVKAMLEWCDQVCVSTAAGALDIADLELAKNNPSPLVVRDALERADRLLKGYRGDDKTELATRRDAVQGWWDRAATAAAQLVAATPGGTDLKAEYGDWVASYRDAAAAFGDHPEWKKACGALDRRAKSENRKAAAALSKLEKGGAKAFGAALKAWEKLVCAPDEPALRTALAQVAPSTDVDPADRDRFTQLLEGREVADAEGRKALATALAEVELATPGGG